MMPDFKLAHALYKKLLTLYPGAFKEQLGESMEQTFADLYHERKQGTTGFVVWMFAETAVWIIKEWVLQIKQGELMKNFRLAVMVGFIFTLPFVLLEFIFNGITKQNLPGLSILFGLLWLLPTTFTAMLAPVVRNVQARNSLATNPLNLLFVAVGLLFIAVLWGNILIDQFPCFIGVPNCD